MFSDGIQETKRQEMSREKLLSKLLLTIQSFTYSCCCESFEARRNYRKYVFSDLSGTSRDNSIATMLSKFGISSVVGDGKLVIMPRPSAIEEEGFQPFSGRLGKLRILALSVMAASGAVAADLVQLVMPFPQGPKNQDAYVSVHKLRAPIAFPLLLGHVLSHVVAAMCATCGRARALSDSLELSWPIPFSCHGTFACNDILSGTVDSVVNDCEGFIKLGLLARLLQVLLGRLNIPTRGLKYPQRYLIQLEAMANQLESNIAVDEMIWIRCCLKLLQVAVQNQVDAMTNASEADKSPDVDAVRAACSLALSSAADFLGDAGTIFQIFVPGMMHRYSGAYLVPIGNGLSMSTFKKLCIILRIESIDDMLSSHLVCQMVASWYDSTLEYKHASFAAKDALDPDLESALRSRLYREHGYRHFDWPSPGVNTSEDKTVGRVKDIANKEFERPHNESAPSYMQLEAVNSQDSLSRTTTDALRSQPSSIQVAFSSLKSAPLLGGYAPDAFSIKGDTSARITVIPSSYTDLYAALGRLLPDCEQTAVCLVCGYVMNASGKGECTRHSYKCGAGAGLFFLLQECSGLIMHKSKAAYIHSPYIDSHGETPQFRGRPLNLDMVRYEHLRELWMGHHIRQTVVAERGQQRQVILPDFY
jgi:hypothetical protein